VTFTGLGLDRRRRKLVGDSFEEERCFMMCCSTKGNDTNDVWRLGVHNRHWNAAKQPEGDETLFVVAKPVIFIRCGKPAKHKFRIREV